jgi:menaquinone-dependent protoporphyrinogen oxidase
MRMKILVLYATTEGQTRKIAVFVAKQLDGDAVSLVDAAEAPPDLKPASFDAVILAASLHSHAYQLSLITFARDHHARLNAMASLFISVSLTAAGKDADEKKGLDACTDVFKAETGWLPLQTLHVAGAFRFTKYDFFKGWVMRLIAWEKNVKVDPAGDLELTDWQALARDIRTFRAGV